MILGKRTNVNLKACLTDGEFGRFLAIGKLCEQLTKSRKHLAEVMSFAKATNRTLVLPKCDAGHIGNGQYYKKSICLYFDLKKIGEYVRWISEDNFILKVEEYELKNKKSPSVSSVYFKWPGQPCDPVSFHSSRIELNSGLTNFSFDFPITKRVMFNGAHSPYGTLFGAKRTMAFLGSSKYICSENCPVNGSLPSPISLLTDSFSEKSEVLVVGKTSPHQCFEREVNCFLLIINFCLLPPF